MSETKAQKEAREKHEAWEKEQEKLGHSIHLPRADETAKDESKKKSGEK